ncbi:MAG: hypothetical protein AAF403_07845, partial [Pseudomonadota bacterium]
MQVFVIQTQPNADQTIVQLKKNNIKAQAMPLMEIDFLPSHHHIELSSSDAFAFTSVNGVRALMRFFKHS